MRTNSRQQSNSTATIWSLALVGFSGLFFWYMGWLPISFETPETGKLVTDSASGAGGADLEEAGGASLFKGFGVPPDQPDFSQADPVAFESQSEPPVVEGATNDAQMLARNKPPRASGSPKPESSPFRPPSDFVDKEESRPSGFDPGDAPRSGQSPNLLHAGEIRVASKATPVDVQRIDAPLGGGDIMRMGGEVAAEPDVPAEVAARLAEIDRLLQNDRRLVAHREMSTLYWVKPEWRPFLKRRIEETALSIYFADLPHYMKPYEVQPGDNLQKIAKKYHVPWEYLVRLNRVDPRRIRPGQKLKVIKGPFSARIDLSEFEMTIHAHGYFVRRFPIGIGRDESTPQGTFTVLSKLVNPKYYGDDAVIEADDPRNPLGERWIDIGDSYGIHGTIDPTSIGKAESRGCIRLNNSDVEVVYDLLSIGSEVVIRP